MLTLLLVEDPQVYLDLQKRLGPRGVKVVNIASGTVALEMIRNLKPALVILGYDLQDLPGK
jgi:DNA-binding response OmpR family regulator